jgi:hypothetical protein
MFNGDIEKGLEIDHIDQGKKNNSIENLRLSNRRLNMINVKARGACKYIGVSFDRRSGTFRAEARVANPSGGRSETIHGTCRKTAEEAALDLPMLYRQACYPEWAIAKADAQAEEARKIIESKQENGS